MPAISVATVDTAGGVIQNSQGIASTVNGRPPAVAGDAVTPHPPCPRVPIHCSAVTTASPGVTVNGIRVTLLGDPATCGHPATSSVASSIDPS